MSTSAIQSNTWLQQLPDSVRAAVDGNKDGRLDTTEVVDFLQQLLAAVKSTPTSASRTSSSASSAATTASTVSARSVSTTPGSPVSGTEPDTQDGSAKNPVSGTTVSSTGTWRDFVFGKSTSGNYAGVMAAPSREVGAGYRPGAFRHQLEGFNEVKFDPSHPEGMTLKMIAARIFEQFDVYGERSFDDVVKAFNDLGIPATKVGIDQIDFGNGEGPVDIIRNAAWLDGDKSAGMAWQWAPELEVEPMNFTMNGGIAPVGAGTGIGETTPIEGGAPTASLYPGAVDQLDLGTVNWLHANVTNWPITSKITDVEIGSDSITIDHTKAGKWPTFNYGGIEIEGNPWVFVNRNGRWYGATYDWLRPGQTEKAVTGNDIGENIKAEPLATWTPQPGELVGFMVSTPARDGNRTSNERSNVVMTRWPA